MGKRKITITVDEDLVEWLRAEDEAVSAVVNTALRAHHERWLCQRALADLLDEWDDEQGPVPQWAIDDAKSAFDELDGISVPAPT